MDPAEAIRLVREPRSADNLQAYFERFEGRYFESFGGGGGFSPHALTAEDIVAVQLLSVSIPPTAVVALMYDDLGRDLTEQLALVPLDVDLGSPEAAVALSRDEPAWRAWNLLLGSKLGLGPTITSKVLARKRPRLVPVWDRVVDCALGEPPVGESWDLMQRLFASELPSVLRAVAAQAGVPEHVAAPRIFDVVVWMRHKDKHRDLDGHCPARLRVA